MGRARRSGDGALVTLSGPKRRPIIDRLMEQVRLDVPTNCWLWTGFLNPNGYARIAEGRERPRYAHRVSYALFVGPIPDGLQIDHLCSNKACVNPGHLEAVTHRENALRYWRKRKEAQRAA